MNLPNKLTVFRIVISFFFLIFLFVPAPGAKTVALVLFIIGIVTDFYDGKLARELNMVTDFGKLVDPLADKILISCAFIAFIQIPPISIPAWMPAVIVIREFSVTTLRLYGLYKNVVIPADRRGKQKMVSQTVTILIGLSILSYRELSVLLSFRWMPYWDQIAATVMWVLTFFTVIHTLATGLCYLWDNRELGSK